MNRVEEFIQTITNLYKVSCVNAKLARAKRTHELLSLEEETLPSYYLFDSQPFYTQRVENISRLSEEVQELKSQLGIIQNAN